MKIVIHQKFLAEAGNLPRTIQGKLSHLLETLELNPFHPLLHTKRLHGDLAGFLSFRITRDWRVVFFFEDNDTIFVLKVRHRKDIYR